MKTLMIGLPTTIFIWVVVFFVYSFRVEDFGNQTELFLINENLMFVESTNDLMMLNCSLMHRRNDVDFAQLDLMKREIDFIMAKDSLEHIIYKIEIDSSVFKNHEH